MEKTVKIRQDVQERMMKLKAVERDRRRASTLNVSDFIDGLLDIYESK